MSFHIFDFGPVSGMLQEYADKDGFIPEAGERWQDFKWTNAQTKVFANKQNGERLWQEFLKKAIAATSKAIAALEELEWQKWQDY